MSRQADFLKSIKEKPLSAKRLAAHIVEDIKGHFAEFNRCKTHYRIKDCDVSNFDESGFQIGVVTGDRVFVSLDCETIYNTDPDNRELVTVVATINYGSIKVPAMIIIKGACAIIKIIIKLFRSTGRFMYIKEEKILRLMMRMS
jgi:hypothetical protein